MNKRKFAYRCGNCGRPRRESEMYKLLPPSLCIHCFKKAKKIIQRSWGWTREGWAPVKEELVPAYVEHRKGSWAVNREI